MPTDWYPPDVAPIYEGVYERHSDTFNMAMYSRWTGFCWKIGDVDFEIALRETRDSGCWYFWRGLTRAEYAKQLKKSIARSSHEPQIQ